MNLSNNKILITGGASGIGLGLTKRFLQENNTVIICGRRAGKLKEVTDRYPDVITKVCDLSKETERIALFEWINTHHPDLNVLVNNAGIQNRVDIFSDKFYSDSLIEIETNTTAPLHLISLFLKLKSLKTIMNVTSGLAFVALAKVPVYCATKAFLHSFTLSLRHLVKPRGIEVIEIIPPALNTDLGGKGLHDGQPEVADFIKAIFNQLKQGKTEVSYGFSKEVMQADPETIAQRFRMMNP